jgi:lysophospholipase L1-like esterase
VRVLHFGDSHAAAKEALREYRGILQAQFGEGGPGFGLPWAQKVVGVSAQASTGWRKDSGAGPTLCGRWLEASRAGERATLEGRFSRFRLHFLRQRGAGSVRILVDGRTLSELSLPSENPELCLYEKELPAGSHKLEILCLTEGPVRLLGVALENSHGAVHSAVALNGSQASWLLGIPEDLFVAQVRAEAPDLLILAFGTNEANDRRFDVNTYRQSLEALLTRFRKAAPDAVLLLTGPPDAQLPKALPGAMDQVIAEQRSAAARFGALFLDRREAMGGPGSMNVWNQSGLVQRDFVHFTGPGYERLSRLVLGSLFQRLQQTWDGNPDARLAKASHGAFSLPATLPAPPAAPRAAKEGNPIYVFRTEDGRTIITDHPNTISGERGDWIGRRPH